MEKSQKNASDAALTDFGFRQVPTGQKQALVRDVFDTVAARYDLMNDLMSGGLHRVWKRRLVEILFLRRSPSRDIIQMADIAGGTGDIAFRAMRAAARGATPSMCKLSMPIQKCCVSGQSVRRLKNMGGTCLLLPAMPSTCRWPITAWTFTPSPLVFAMLPTRRCAGRSMAGAQTRWALCLPGIFAYAKRAFDTGL